MLRGAEKARPGAIIERSLGTDTAGQYARNTLLVASRGRDVVVEVVRVRFEALS